MEQYLEGCREDDVTALESRPIRTAHGCSTAVRNSFVTSFKGRVVDGVATDCIDIQIQKYACTCTKNLKGNQTVEVDS